MSAVSNLEVVVVNDHHYIPGGAAKAAVLSAKALAELGIPTTLFSYYGPVMDGLDGVPNLTNVWLGKEWKVPRVPDVIRLAWNEEAVQAMRELLKGKDPKRTIVHPHTWWSGLSAGVPHVAAEMGFPVLLSLHDYLVACPTGHFLNRKLNGVCPLPGGGFRCSLTNCTEVRHPGRKIAALYRYRVQRNRAKVPSGIRHFVVYSQKSRKVLEPYLPEKATLHPMRYPIEVAQEPRVDVGRNDTFVFSGRLSPEKNPLLLVRAAKKVGAKVRFIGDGPMRGAVEAEGYAGASVSGWQDAAGLMRELSSARCLVLPSLWFEVNPLAPLEALGRGIPAIVSDVTTSVEEVEHGVTGWHFRSDDVDDLADKMARMLDGEAADRMGQTAYETFWARPPSVENHIKSLLSAYSEILEPRAAVA